LTIVLAAAAARGKDLGDLLVEKGIISQKDLEELRKQAQETQSTGAAAPTPAAVAPAVAVPAAVPPPGAAPSAAAAAAPAGAPAPGEPTPGLDALVKNEVEHQLPDWLRHFKISTLIYMDWAYYFQTGYGPQFLTQITPPGPGNDGFNSFDLTRAYINLFWKPSDRFTIRVTPNVFREIDVNAASNTSQSSQVATNVNGNLTYRLKYGYLQANNILNVINPDLPEINYRVGQMENPLIPWEEDLYGYRFVNLVPLNYLAYSSTDLGMAFLGPVKVDGIRYADYWLGVYNGSSFHSAEFNEKKSPQGRVSAYPAAAVPGLENLGVTYFMSYGYTNVAPDTEDAVIRRMAGLVHYTNKYGGIAFEWDRTRNQNNFNNFFSGAAPKQTIPNPNSPGQTITNPLYTLYNQILNPTAIGQGFDVFGHLNIFDYPFSLFGMWQRWYPNLDVSSDPLDFDRFVFGVAWTAQPWLRLALDTQNLVYLHSGPTVPAATTSLFTNLEINY
jgi:hypothetical protein